MNAAASRLHVVVGEREQVGAALERARRDGRLRMVHEVAELGDGQVCVRAELAEPPALRTRWQKVRPWLLGAAAVAGLVVVAGVVWLLVLAVLAVIALVQTVVAWVSAHLLVIGLVLAGLVLLACMGGARCVGLHCGGCRG
jgi:small-conductance mechanosensitive channel